MFIDRHEAGQRLAHALAGRHYVNPVVLALPRGGVPVAAEVAHALRAPLDLLLVRKIGARFQPELAMAAVAEGPEAGAAPGRDYSLEVRESEGGGLQADVQRELREIGRRRDLYLHGRARVPVTGRTVIVIDDGIATGTTLRAALRSLRARQPSRIVVAVPVAPPDEIERLRHEVDEVVCLETPEPFGAIGCFYERFDQLSDDEVIALLATRPPRGAEAGAEAMGDADPAADPVAEAAADAPARPGP